MKTDNRLKVLFEDEDIIVVEKKEKTYTISRNGRNDPNLYHEVGEYLRKKDREAKVFIVHRLDYDTSGLMVFAKNFKAKNDLQKLFEEGKILRYYQAVLSSPLKKDEGKIVNYLKEDKFHNIFVKSHPDRFTKEAVTLYKVAKKGRHPEVLIQILTGRRNQIRLAFASLGSPILGDSKYGGEKARRMFLHASELDLRAYKKNGKYDFHTTRPLF